MIQATIYLQQKQWGSKMAAFNLLDQYSLYIYTKYNNKKENTLIYMNVLKNGEKQQYLTRILIKLKKAQGCPFSESLLNQSI